MSATDYLANNSDKIRLSLESEYEEWNRFLNADLSGELGPNVLDIKIDNWPVPVFSKMLAELLLGDAGALIDKAQSLRAMLDEARTKAFETKHAIEEFLDLNKISMEEEKLMEEEKCSKERKQKLLIKQTTALEKSIQAYQNAISHLHKFSGPIRDITATAAYLNNGGPNFERGDEHFPLESTKFGQYSLPAIRDEFSSKLDLHLVGGATADIHYFSSSLRSQLDSTVQLHVLNAQYERLASDKLTLDDSIAELTVEIKNSATRIDLVKRRNERFRKTGCCRLEAMMQRGGALDFKSRARRLKIRYDDTVKAAYAKLVGAENGLRFLYNYNNSIDSSDGAYPPPEGKRIKFDDMVRWADQAILWLSEFQDRQQASTQVFSLLNILGPDQFNACRTSGEWLFSFRSSDFKELSGVRLRSVAARLLTSGNREASWNARIYPPEVAVLDFSYGHVAKIVTAPGTALALGRIQERTSSMTLEYNASPAVFNLSPIALNPDQQDGMWRLQLIGPSTAQNPVEHIDDIEILFGLVAFVP